jgi:beta-glucosidase
MSAAAKADSGDSAVAFAKTRLLEPGEVESLTLDVRLDDCSSYDDTGSTGHRSAWVLEAGT